MEDKIVKIWVDQDNVNIRISINDLLTLAERHPYNPVKVVKISQFLKEYKHELENWTNQIESDGSMLEYVIEECIQQVYENGTDVAKEMRDPDTGELYPEYQSTEE